MAAVRYIPCGESYFLFLRERFKPRLPAHSGENCHAQIQQEVTKHIVPGMGEATQGAMEEVGRFTGLTAPAANRQIVRCPPKP